MKLIKLSVIILLFFQFSAYAKTRKYEFNIDYKTVNFSGKEAVAIAVGDSIPAPTLYAELGDILEVTFHNKLDQETSIHWHGVLLPPEQDGVARLNTKPLKAKESLTFSYKVKHLGTFWYHAHTKLHEQKGVYGGIIFAKKGEDNLKEIGNVVVLSDWIDANPERVLKNLIRDELYYTTKRKISPSWKNVIKHSKHNGSIIWQTRLKRSWQRKPPISTHLSDIGYDAYLANGKQQYKVSAKKGDMVKIRLINAGSASFFKLTYAGGPLTIIEADGNKVVPLKAEVLLMGIAETYDILVPVKDNKLYELRATAQGENKHSSILIGNIAQQDFVEAPNPPMHKVMLPKERELPKREMVNSVLNYMDDYNYLQAPQKTAYNKDYRSLEFTLESQPDQYSWSINNKVLSEAKQIWVKKGEVVRLKFINNSAMQHPMHLHGHFFRVLNKHGEYSPLKHTVIVDSFSELEIELFANEEKDWFFHCHNLYHTKTGMSRVLSYEKSSTATEEIMSKLTADRKWYFFGELGSYYNQSEGNFSFVNRRAKLDIEFDNDYKDQYSIEPKFLVRTSRFSKIYFGGEFEKYDNEQAENVGTIGLNYILPLFFVADFRLDSDDEFQFSLENEVILSDSLKFEWDWNDSQEYNLKLEKRLSGDFFINLKYNNYYQGALGVSYRF